MAYADLEPFGPEAEAWRAGLIASTIANVNRDPKKRARPFTVQDFMPAEPMTDAERADALQSRIHAAMMGAGGRVRKPGERAKRKGDG